MKAKIVILLGIVSMFLVGSLPVSGNLIKSTKDENFNHDLVSLFTETTTESLYPIASSVCWCENELGEILPVSASLSVEYYGLQYVPWDEDSGYWLYKYRVNSFFESRLTYATCWLKQMDVIADPKDGIVDPFAAKKGGMNLTDGDWEDGSNIWESTAVAVCSRAIAEVNPYVAVGISGAYLAFNLLRDLNHNAEYGQEVYSWVGSTTRSTTEASGILDFGFLVEPNTHWELELNLDLTLDRCCPQPPLPYHIDLAGSWGLMGTNGTITLEGHSPGLVGITEPADGDFHIRDVHVEADAADIVDEVEFRAEGGLAIPGLESLITACDSHTDYDPEFKADLDPNLIFWIGDIIAIAKKDGKEVDRDRIENVLIFL